MRYALDPVTAECPACTAEAAERLYTCTAEEVAQHFVAREVEPARHEALRAHLTALWSGSTCRMVRCKTCGLGFADPFVAGDHTFYDLAFPPQYNYPQHRWEFGRSRDALDVVLGAEGWKDVRLLEVGGGDGAFLRHIVPSRMTPDRVVELEVSSGALANVRAMGVTALDADVRTLGPEHDGRYGVACFFQCFLHFDRFDTVLDAVSRVTTPGARLFISVPNLGRITFGELNGALMDYPPMQATRWTREAFAALAGRTGWRLVAHEVEPERALPRIGAFVADVYRRNRQRPGSIENWAERLGPGRARTLARAALAATNLVRRAPTLAALVRDPNLAASQWAMFEKA